jgi:hypothetical protein
MKQDKKSNYPELSSFEDFRFESERLRLKLKLTEAKLDHSFAMLSREFSVSNILVALAKDYILPRVNDIIGNFLKTENNNESATPADS